MQGIENGLAVVSGLLVRLAIPLLATIAVSWALRQLDRRWQREADEYRTTSGLKPVEIIRCWVLNDCPPEKREACPAYANRQQPCWQVFRDQQNRLADRCLTCPVFRSAPAPQSI
jgi:hypothetical protein